MAAGAGLAFVGLAAGLFTAAAQSDALLRCDPDQPCAATEAQAKSAHDTGVLMQGIGIGSLAAAAVCTGLAVWLFLRSDEPPPVALFLAPNAVGLSARW